MFTIPAGPLKGLSSRQVFVVLVFALFGVLAVIKFGNFQTSFQVLYGRAALTALTLLLVFTLMGNLRLPWLPHRAARFLAVPLVAPLALLATYLITIPRGVGGFLSNRSAQTGWLIMSGVAVIVGLLMAFMAIDKERDREASDDALRFSLERERLQRQAATARLQIMSSQIQPHFLFNALANVQQLIESNSPRAAPLLGDLIEYLRGVVSIQGKLFIELRDEFELAVHYLAIMQMRMPDRLRFEVSLPDELASQAIPPLALLTLVENAVAHGVDPAESGGAVSVVARLVPEGVSIEVHDTADLLSSSIREGTGLTNLRERLQTAWGESAAVALNRGANGTTARLLLPRVAASVMQQSLGQARDDDLVSMSATT